MIRLENVSKRYQHRGSEVVALRSTSLEVDPGEFLAIVGPSGSGKTTLLSTLGGMLAPSSGAVWLDGRSLYAAAARERAEIRQRRIGFVFQTFNLIPYLTALENVVIPLELGSLPVPPAGVLADRVGRAARKREGQAAWQRTIMEIVPMLQEAFLADYVALGGGNARRVTPLPPHTRRGSNHDAFVGGCRLWEEDVEPHDRVSAAAWRIVR